MKDKTQNPVFPGIALRLFRHRFRGVQLKTLVFSLQGRREILSTREGFREVNLVAENYCPPELWDFVHGHPDEFFEEVHKSLGLSKALVSFLFTGADVEKGVFHREGDEVLAFVTADTMNAMCAGRDRPSAKRAKAGTINIFLFTQAELSQAAMARTLVTVTEAKVEALRELDVRSVYDPSLQATGTGTDNVVIISGKGRKVERLRGHSELSRLIAKVVLEATKEAVRCQGGRP